MSHLKNDKGMTLIEVIVAIAIFAIAAIPLLGIFSNSVISSQDSRIKTKEALIAQSIIENIKAGNIKSNSDLEKFPIPDGFNIIISEPLDLGNDLMEYHIKVFKINSKLPSYDIYALAPSSQITLYTPKLPPNDGNSSENNSQNLIDYFINLIRIIVIATWTSLFMVYVIYKLGWNNNVKNIIIDIGNMVINYIKNGITKLKIIGEKAAQISNINIPWWLKWW